MFAPIKLQWQGRAYEIPANRVLMAIAEAEEVLTLDELQRFAARGTAPTAKLSMAYGRLLRFAGATVADDEVFAGMLTGDQGEVAAAATSALLALMLPPPDALNGATGKSAAGKPRAKGNGSSVSSTK